MHRRRQLLHTFIKIFITAGLMAWVFQSLDRQALYAAFANLHPLPVVLSTIIIWVAVLLQVLRWRIIAAAIDKPWRFLPALRIIVIGVFFSQFLPTSIGGDIMRVWQLHRGGMPLAKAFNSVAIDRIMALVAIALIVLGGLVLLPGLVADSWMQLAAWLTVAVILLVPLLPLALRAFPLAMRAARLRFLAPLRRIMHDLLLLVQSRRALTQVIFLSIAMQVLVSSTVWILGWDTGAEISFFSCMILFPLVLLLTMLPISVAGWGVREGAMVVAFKLMGAEPSAAVSVSITFGLILLVSGIPGGIVWLYARSSASTPPASLSPGAYS